MSAALAVADAEVATWGRMLGARSVRVENASSYVQSRRVARQRDPANDVSREYADTQGSVGSHSSSPSQLPENGEKETEMHQPTSGRISGVPSKTEVRSKIAGALREAASTAKPIARISGASVDTAEGWRNEINIPGGYNLIVLARQLPQVRAVVRQLIDSDFDADPRAYAMFIEAMRYAQERMK
jgi:hypothetical protein